MNTWQQHAESQVPQMSADNFAKTPQPPYYAVIFSSQRRANEAGYGAIADRMVELAAEQPAIWVLRVCVAAMASESR